VKKFKSRKEGFGQDIVKIKGILFVKFQNADNIMRKDM